MRHTAMDRRLRAAPRLLGLAIACALLASCSPSAAADSRKAGPRTPDTAVPDRYILQLDSQSSSLTSLPTGKAQNTFGNGKSSSSIPGVISTQVGAAMNGLFPSYSTAGSSSPKNPVITKLLQKVLTKPKKNNTNSGLGDFFGDFSGEGDDVSDPGFVNAQDFKAGGYEGSHATFYGEPDGSGTMGGACGYGNLYQTGYGLRTAAASDAMFKDGFICGACYQVKCLGSPALPGRPVCSGKSVTVTITNRCPAGGNGVCSPPKHHLDMSEASWGVLSSVRGAGILETQMRRVPCRKKGGVAFMLTGHEYYLQVLVFNVAGVGEINKLEVDNGSGFQAMDHNWGAMYSKSAKLGGKELSFRLTGTNGDILTVNRAVPSSWYPGAAYMSRVNFKVPPKGKKKKTSSSSSSKSSKGRKNLEVWGPLEEVRLGSTHFEEDSEDHWGPDSPYGKVLNVNVTVGMIPRH
eukprot:TRINITY_DN2649_c0_g1_i1.p1 TRINITY_DN2649_c0_g1~~TRINITY_DN2649_c0_g1_i1.p1  ORF type:complete len:462 (+),score=-14.97 TRINITY_DN2649_c0_g1_i1:182-1567(+)